MRVGVGVCVRAPYSIKHLIKKERYINFFYKTKILAHETNWSTTKCGVYILRNLSKIKKRKEKKSIVKIKELTVCIVQIVLRERTYEYHIVPLYRSHG